MGGGGGGGGKKRRHGHHGRQNHHHGAGGGGGGGGGKRNAREDERLAEVRRRAAAIDSYVDMIPARFYLSLDNPQVQANKGPWDPKKTKTTSQLVEAAAAAQHSAEGGAAAGGAAGGAEGAAAAPGGVLSKAAKRRQQRRGGKTPEEVAAARQQLMTSNSDSRAELHSKLERRIAELKEERRRRQSEKDKAKAAEVRASTGKEAKAPRRAPGGEGAAGAAGGAASEGAEGAAAKPEIGRVSFEGGAAGSASQPFEAGVGKRGDKVRRLRAELRKQEQDDDRLRKAEQRGADGEELRQELALQKALRRARGEKVHDDASKLRKAQKALEGKKKKSKDRWDTLKDAQKKMFEEKQEKRKENLAKPRGKKRKLRSGFEGQRGSDFINSEKQ